MTPLFSRYFLNSCFFDSGVCFGQRIEIVVVHFKQTNKNNQQHQDYFYATIFPTTTHLITGHFQLFVNKCSSNISLDQQLTTDVETADETADGTADGTASCNAFENQTYWTSSDERAV
jgi:hypothetical protein